MIISNFDFDSPLDFKNTKVIVLVVEDESLFYNYCKEFNALVSGGVGRFSLYDKEEELNFSKTGIVVNDIFSLSLNDKKFVTKLYQHLQNFVDVNYLIEYTEIQAKIFSLLNMLSIESDYPIHYDAECGIASLLKSYGVRFEEEDTTLVQLLVSFIHIGASFLKNKTFYIY